MALAAVVNGSRKGNFDVDESSRDGSDWLSTVSFSPDSRLDCFWTGPVPSQGAPGVLPDGSVTSLPFLDLRTCSRKDVLDYFDNSWLLTEVLFASIKDEATYVRPPHHNLRHPMVFYYGHSAVFYANKLRVAGLLDDPLDAYLEAICETGVDEMSWDDLSKNEMKWPSLKEVWAYRKQVYALVKNIIETHPAMDDLPVTWDKPMWALHMCFDHERIHLETSSVLLREMSIHLVKRPLQWPDYPPTIQHNEAPKNHFIDVPEGNVTVGMSKDYPSFAWDNAFGKRDFTVAPFAATAMLISNGEFLEFVKDGGYRDAKFWSEEGLQWRTFRNAKWPPFWIPDGPAGLHKYKLRMIFEEVEMKLDLPVVVNLHEARAYCSWLSKKDGLSGDLTYRVMTEVEHHRIRDLPAGPDVTDSNAIMVLPGSELKGSINFNLAYGAEGAVNGSKPTSRGFHDVFGNLWQWCEDYFAALPGNRGVHKYYDDFSTPCYDGHHNMIHGGSFISSGTSASTFSRDHFRPHFFQHAGFRVVKPTAPMQLTHVDSPPPHVGNWNPTSNPDDQNSEEQLLAKFILTSYPMSEEISAGNLGLSIQPGSFPKLYTGAVQKALKEMGMTPGNALEVGCLVGGTCFQLAGWCDSVVGVDVDGGMIKAAKKIQQNGEFEVMRAGEGELSYPCQVTCAIPSDARKNVLFRHMDPCCLLPDTGVFDCVLLTNVLEKVASPNAVLSRMGGSMGVVKKGGALVVACSGDWSEKVSEKGLWLEGRKEGKSMVDSIAGVIGAEFQHVKNLEVPCLTPRSTRKYELTLIKISMWVRRDTA
ncbi:hypothetical protein BSKO_00378 [Bryopsis sp. KO-2023]|nr:hypothetical protein BSKO_00378 [Bryopsis sp. KO-2023]